MTSITLCSRIDEHTGVSYRTGARLIHPPHSAVRDRVDVCYVRVDTADCKVLGSSSNALDLKILVSTHF